MSDNPTFYWDIVSPPCRSVKALMDIGKVPCKYIYVNISVG